jgi:hypothetical protein
MMPSAIAEALGIDRERSAPRPSLGVSMDPIDGFLGHLTFRLEHQADSFDAPVIFIDTDVPVLLGREGVNRHSIGPPDRHPKGTPLSYVLND